MQDSYEKYKNRPEYWEEFASYLLIQFCKEPLSERFSLVVCLLFCALFPKTCIKSTENRLSKKKAPLQ